MWWPLLYDTAEQCSLKGAQLRSTTRPFVQWNLILTHLQHSKFPIIYIYIYLLHRSLTTWNASLVVCSHGCAIACTLKQTSAQCKIFLEGTLLLRQCYNKIFGGSQNNALPLIINILLSLFRVPVVICLSNNVNCHAAILMFNLLD